MRLPNFEMFVKYTKEWYMFGTVIAVVGLFYYLIDSKNDRLEDCQKTNDILYKKIENIENKLKIIL